MSPLHARQYGLDAYRYGPPESLWSIVKRRFQGRYPIDPFGLDPHLCDQLMPLAEPLVRVEVDGGERIPSEGAAVLVANRGIGIGEPAALAVAVKKLTGRRLRFAAGPDLGPLNGLGHRLGGLMGHPSDLASLLRAGHLVSVPLGPTWLKTEAGPPPLALCAAMLGFTVFPVAVTPGGPFGAALRPWRVRVGAHVALDSSYGVDDPLAAAELGDAVRDAIDAMIRGGDTGATRVPSALVS